VDEYGRPRDSKRPVIYWDGSRWIGDVPDGGWPPLINKRQTRLPFIMKPHGVAHIFGPGRADGPFPEHYEPLESPLKENPFSKTHRINPVVRLFYGIEDIFSTYDKRYPYVATTYRVSEHWQTGVLTRHQPWQLEMMPQQFIELSRELAREKGIKSGDKVIVSSIRGKIWAIAIVTNRLRPFKIGNLTVHQVGLPWCFGWQYPEDLSGGDSSNLLTPTIGDANTMIPETKAFMVNIEKA
jgi:formate dehydrogenase major subunit